MWYRRYVRVVQTGMTRRLRFSDQTDTTIGSDARKTGKVIERVLHWSERTNLQGLWSLMVGIHAPAMWKILVVINVRITGYCIFLIQIMVDIWGESYINCQYRFGVWLRDLSVYIPFVWNLNSVCSAKCVSKSIHVV